SNAGFDEQLDADRFIAWLDVLMDSGEAVAAQKMAAIDIDLTIAALAAHVRVFDCAAVSDYVTLDGEEIAARRSVNDGLASELGGYLIQATRDESWATIVGVLTCLEDHCPDHFD